LFYFVLKFGSEVLKKNIYICARYLTGPQNHTNEGQKGTCEHSYHRLKHMGTQKIEHRHHAYKISWVQHTKVYDGSEEGLPGSRTSAMDLVVALGGEELD
jgi:hypothetical protein